MVKQTKIKRDPTFAAEEHSSSQLASSPSEDYLIKEKNRPPAFEAEEASEEQLVSKGPSHEQQKDGKTAHRLEKKHRAISLGLDSVDSNRAAKQLAMAPAQVGATSVATTSMGVMSHSVVSGDESRPGAERVAGPFSTMPSVGTIVVGGGSDEPTAITQHTEPSTIVEAELVRDKTVQAIPLSEDVEQGYQELQKDYSTLRKRVFVGIVVGVLLIGGIVTGVLLGTRGGGDTPTPAPTLGPDDPNPEEPAARCLVDLEVSCAVDGRASASCEEIPTSCTSPPVTLVFQYNGANCSESFHNQRTGSFVCVDLGEQLQQPAYIVARDVATNLIYRQGPIAVDGIFWASNFQSQLGEVMNVTVYASSVQSPENIIQTFVYQSDCSQDLSLSNRFGALTLTRLITEEQGVVESDNGFVNLTYTFAVSNSGAENVTLESLQGTVNNMDEFELSVAQNNEGQLLLAPGSSRDFQQTVSVDLTMRQLYVLNASATAAVQGETMGCAASNFLEFEAGVQAPTETPTLMPVVPSPAPTNAPLPSRPPIPPPIPGPTPPPTPAPTFPPVAPPFATPTDSTPPPTPAPTIPTVPTDAPTNSARPPASSFFPSGTQAPASTPAPSSLFLTFAPVPVPIPPQPSEFPMNTPPPTPNTPPPTPVPTFAPVSSTASPSPPTSTPPPTFAPTTFPPTPELTDVPVTFDCTLNVEVNCMLSDGSASCASIPPLSRTQCSQRPLALNFRYVGGDCMDSFTDQDTSQFQCIDFDTAAVSENVFLVVFDVTSGIVYESRFIAVGDEFSVQDFGSEGNVLNITTYASSDISPQNMIQTVVFDRSCSSPLSLADRFGSSQLVVYVNSLQGVVTSVVQATYTISISVDSQDSAGVVTSLTSLLEETEIVDLTSAVDGSFVSLGQMVRVEQSVRVDLSSNRLVSNAVTAVVQRDVDGVECSASNLFQFEVIVVDIDNN